LRTFLTVCWRLGVKYPGFWRHLAAVRRHDARRTREFFEVSILIEQFAEHRQTIRDRIQRQLATPRYSQNVPKNTL
jgi:hypothetical protein